MSQIVNDDQRSIIVLKNLLTWMYSESYAYLHKHIYLVMGHEDVSTQKSAEQLQLDLTLSAP